jgi:putative DNA primase/helicase
MSGVTEQVRTSARTLAAGPINKGYKPVAIHTYTTIDGQPIYWKIRLKHPETGDKWIRPMHFDGTKFVLTEPTFVAGKPLYRLHQLATRQDETIVVVEGENGVDALADLNFLATTSGGAGSADSADWQPLAGRSVVIWPDADEAGQGYAQAVAAKLSPLGCAVRIIDVSALDLPAKGDCVDWLAVNCGATAEDVLALAAAEYRAPAACVDASCPASRSGHVQIVIAATIEPEPIGWLWPGYLAAGKFHLMAGAPGTGKTTVALAIAATVSVGGQWPDGTQSEAGDVLIWTAEDDPADTIVPRLHANGANVKRCHIITGYSDERGARPFDPATDMPALLNALASHTAGIKLLIIDPVVSAVSGDSHKNTETRRGLQPIVDAAARLRCAVIGISHFSKGTAGREPVERVTGSIAFGALPRVVFATAKRSADNDEGRMLVRAKSNIGPDGGGFKYYLCQVELVDHVGIYASQVLWGDAIDGAARDLLAIAEATDGSELSATDEAVKWLADLLAGGPMAVADVQKEARQASINDKPLRTARERLGIKSRKREFSGGWEWGLPDEVAQESPRCPPKITGTLGARGHLGEPDEDISVAV